jgi:uncharacterized protein (TIGR02145 family)
MKENLNYGIMINGTIDQTNNGMSEKYCYDDLESNCEIYGGLYQWAEMVQYLNGASNTSSWSPIPSGPVTGICPSGWHIPSDNEFSELSNVLGGESMAGGNMKEVGTRHWFEPNTGATNFSEFTALPGGNRYNGQSFGSLGSFSFLWTSTQKTELSSWLRTLNSENASLECTFYGKTNGCTVRCVLD